RRALLGVLVGVIQPPRVLQPLGERGDVLRPRGGELEVDDRPAGPDEELLGIRATLQCCQEGVELARAVLWLRGGGVIDPGELGMDRLELPLASIIRRGGPLGAPLRPGGRAGRGGRAARIGSPAIRPEGGLSLLCEEGTAASRAVLVEGEEL